MNDYNGEGADIIRNGPASWLAPLYLRGRRRRQWSLKGQADAVLVLLLQHICTPATQSEGDEHIRYDNEPWICHERFSLWGPVDIFGRPFDTAATAER